ncbi:MAG: CvpA family protein [Acidobacteria bacterium]|nr:CvpA family protein [Acidobacteriota bacterium]
MTPLDAVLVAILVMALGCGLWKGFVRMALGTAGVVVSTTLAMHWAGLGPQWFRGIIGSREVARGAAFALVFALGMLATALVTWGAHRLLRAAHVGWLDRLAGGAVGLLGAAFVLAALFVGLSVFVPGLVPAARGSAIAPFLWRVADLTALILPPPLAAEYHTLRGATGPAPATPVPPAKGGRS